MFQPRDAARLARSVHAHRHEVEPLSVAGVGRLPFKVRRYEGMTVVEEFTVTADVRRRVLGLVAVRRVDRGAVITAGDVEMKELWIASDDTPLDSPRLAVGQVARSVVKPGTPITSGTLRSPVLIKRGELVTVRCLAGRLVVRTVGRAMEEGTRDDVIRVRNEASRETFNATVTGRKQVTLETQTGDVR